jgi:hypothetical protein
LVLVPHDLQQNADELGGLGLVVDHQHARLRGFAWHNIPPTRGDAIHVPRARSSGPGARTCVARPHAMPRKQRFKPSRKPSTQPNPAMDHGGEHREAPPEDIEVGNSRNNPSEIEGGGSDRSR